MSNRFHDIIQGFVNSYLRNNDDRWFGLFGLELTFVPSDKLPTAAVTVRGGRMLFYYNEDFIKDMDDAQIRYLYLHEIFHLISGHISRFRIPGANHEVMNIAADMIINSNIEKGICIAPTKRPTENVLLLPDDYSDVHVLEPLYEWLLKSGKVKFVDPFDCHNLESDDPDTWNATVDNAIKSATARGNVSNNIQKLIGELRHTSENYLRVLKKVLAQECGYAVKDKTWTRENRYELEAKGKRKRGQVINAVVDTSGSMWGVLDEAFSVLFRDGYIINLVLSDCEVKDTKRLYSKNDLKKLKASGGGGTAMQPGIDYCQEHWPHIPTIVITDGFCEPSLTFHGTGNVLLLVDTGNPDIIGRARVIRKR